MKFPQNRSAGELQSVFLEKIIAFDFLELKVTFHIFDHASIFAKSRLRIAVVSAGSLPVASKEVSSGAKDQLPGH